MNSVQVCSFLALFAAFIVISQADPSGRLINGQPVDNLRQFPHHVSIVVSESEQKCGGSIINEHWILTSASCVKYGTRLDLYFRKKHEYDFRADYFSISVNRDQVFLYPTNYDDIALIKVPITLIFSESLAPVNVSRLPIEALRGRFTVMPGFSDYYYDITTVRDESTTCATTTTAVPPTTPCYNCPTASTNLPIYNPHHDHDHDHDYEQRIDNLKYGQFNVIENRICKHTYGGQFDEYTQLCIESWGDNPNRPGDSDYGSGLIAGWPARSELVGLFSMKADGFENRKPWVFTFVGKYMGWIESLVRG